MTYRILTEREYEAFAAAEKSFYDGDGFHAFTDVREREDTMGLAMLWDDALSTLQMIVEDADGGDADYVLAECARIIAVANYYALLGELPKNERRTPVIVNGVPTGEYFINDRDYFSA